MKNTKNQSFKNQAEQLKTDQASYMKSPSCQNSFHNKDSEKIFLKRKIKVNSSIKSKCSLLNYKTPQKLDQNVEAFTTVKPGLNNKPWLKSPKKELSLCSQSNNSTSEKDNSDCNLDKTTSNFEQKVKVSFSLYHKKDSISTFPSHTKNKNTPIFQTSHKKCQEDSTAHTSKSRKRKYCKFDPTQIPSSNRKLKKNKRFYCESIRFADTLKGKSFEFQVFKDSELGNNKFIQAALRECRIDDDCPTDSEQIETAIHHAQRELYEAICLEQVQTDLDNKVTPKASKIFSSDEETDKYSDSNSNSSIDVYEVEAVTLSAQSNRSLQASTSIVKKLSFSDVEYDI